MADAIRVLVVADNVLARAGLAALVDNQEGCEVVGQVSGGRGLADQIDLIGPDVVLVDLGWKIEDGLATLSTLSQLETTIVALLANEDDAPAAVTALADTPLWGLMLNERDPDALLMAIQAAFAGLIVIDPDLSGSLIAKTPAAEGGLVEELTPRENDVLQLLSQGLTNKAIALRLEITDHTVKFHVNAIMTKLGAQSRTDAVIRATRAGLIIL